MPAVGLAMAKKVYENASEFDASLQAWATVEVPATVDKIKIAIALDLFRGLILATPVGNPSKWKSLSRGRGKKRRKPPRGYVGGTARASWFVSDTRPAADPVVKNLPFEQASNLGEGMAQITNMKGKTQIWVANNLPYIGRIMQQGWSQQVPKLTFTRVVERVRRKWVGT
jgi:hypothetical protein